MRVSARVARALIEYPDRAEIYSRRCILAQILYADIASPYTNQVACTVFPNCA